MLKRFEASLLPRLRGCHLAGDRCLAAFVEGFGYVKPSQAIKDNQRLPLCCLGNVL